MSGVLPGRLRTAGTHTRAGSGTIMEGGPMNGVRSKALSALTFIASLATVPPSGASRICGHVLWARLSVAF